MGTRHFLRTATALVTTIVVILTSGALGVVPMGIASAHAREVAARPEPPTDDGSSRFAPTIHAPNLPVSAWQAPKSTSHGPVLKNVSATSGATSLGEKRIPGEQIDMRTENTKTFLNADGTWTLKAYSVPVQYKDAKGDWQDIDNTLVTDASDAGYVYGNKANDWHIHFADKAGGSHLMHLQSPDVTLTETLDAASSVPAASNGRQIDYAGVFPDVDLLYGLGNAHVEETLLLHSAQVPASYTFTEHLPGATAHEDAAGNIIFTDARNGRTLLEIGGVELFEADTHGRMLPAGAGTQAVKVSLSGSGPDFTITLVPDHAWLSDPSRHFPVAIDPTIGPLSSATTTDATSSGNTYSDTLDESTNPTWSFYNNPVTAQEGVAGSARLRP
jgi:hypothetical protein